MAQTGLAEHSRVWEQYRAIRQNDDAALRQFYASNYPRIENFVLNNNGTSEQAKDLFQEAFIAVWRNIQLDRFQPQNETALDGYLYQVAKNKWLDYLRSGHYNKVVRMDTGDLNMPVNETKDQPEENEYLAAVKKHFADLGENCKKILTLYYYDNESMRTIAERMGWTEATAKNNKYRCIQKLKELINQ